MKHRIVAVLLAASVAAPVLAEGPSASELPAAPAAPSADACRRLTPDALSAAQSGLGGLMSTAESALAAHGTGAYPGAMKRALDQFAVARDKMQALASLLGEAGLFAPHVSNTTGAYDVAGYSREALGALDLGRHWASVATAYDRSAIGRQLLTDAAKVHAVIADLESDGLACYVSAYVP